MASAFQAILPTLLIQGSLVISGILSARLLGPEARGYLALAILIPSVTALVGTFGLQSAITFFAARARGQVQLGRSVVAFLVVLTLGLTVLDAGLVSLLFADDPPAVFQAVLPTIAITPLIVYQSVVMALLQGHSRFAAMNLVRVAPFLGWAIGVLLLGVTNGATLASLSIALVTAYGLGSVLAALAATRLSASEGAPSMRVRALVSFGGRGFIGTAAPLENLQLDGLTIGTFQGPTSLGYYSTAQAFYTLPRLLGQSIGMLALPRAAALPRAERRRFIGRVLVISAASLGAVAIGIALLVPFAVPLLFGPEFAASIPVAQVLLVTALMLALRRVGADLLRADGRPGGDSISEIVSWPVLGIGFAIASTRGPLEIAIATAAASSVAMCATMLLLAFGMKPGARQPASIESPNA